mmetsp:Transcript_80453/g.139629  ORF Transcript_80453/g.139629 Transcript_80453/m.139629 type:complete len:528 (+) Transcript_80453:125-1708(+)
MVYTAGLVRSERHDGGNMLVFPDGHMVSAALKKISQPLHAVRVLGAGAADDPKVQGLQGHGVESFVTMRAGRNGTLPPEALAPGALAPGAFQNETMRLEKEFVIFWDAPHSDWIVLFGVVFTLIFLEQAVLRSISGGYRSHLLLVFGWVGSAVCYNLYYLTVHGQKDGLDWFIGYVLEWMLSIDNLFAFQFIIRAYSCPVQLQHKAIFCGAIGALVTRMLLYFAIGSALHLIHYVQFLFGGFLIYAGIQALYDEDDNKDPRDFWLVRLLKACLGKRLHEGYDMQGQSLFIRQHGILCATLLVPLIFCVEVTDVVFAVDSVSAKVAQIPNQYIAYSSSVMALLGLRAMFFVIEDLVAYFESLKYGVCFILVFIGSELLISGWFQLPDWCVCMVIVSVFNVCIVISVLNKLFKAQSPHDASAMAAPEDSATIQPPSEPQPIPPIPQSQAQHTEAPQNRQTSGPVSQSRMQREAGSPGKAPESRDEQMGTRLAARLGSKRAGRVLESAASATGGTGDEADATPMSTEDHS